MPGAPVQLFRSNGLNSKIRRAILEERRRHDPLPRRVRKRAGSREGHEQVGA